MVAAGVFVGYESGALASYATWVGSAPSNVLNSLNQTSWSAFDSSIPYAVNWAKSIAASNIWSVPLTVSGTSLEQVATGAYDSHFLLAATGLAQTKPSVDGNIYIRVGWEFNGDWMPWAAQGHEDAFVKAFQELVTTFRSVSDKFKFVWDTNDGGSVDPAKAYPGDKYVDVVGMDVYYKTQWDSTNPTTAFQTKVSEQYGLQWQQDFAAAHGKATAISEWGVATDNSGPYIQAMAKWMADHNMVYENYWNSNADYSGQLSNGQYPDAGAAYQTAIASLQSGATSTTAAPATSIPVSTVTLPVAAPSTTSNSDTLAPAAVGVALAHDTGVSSTDRVTSDASLSLTGIAAGATLGYVVDGTASATYAPGQLAQGAHTVAVTQTDAAGNTSVAASLSFSLAPDISGAATTSYSVGDRLYALYDGLLGRAPDLLGLESWGAAVNAGTSFNAIAAAMLASPEGQARVSAADSATFVEQLYQTDLHRASDPAGKAAWLSALSSGTSRADVALGFAFSNEHMANLQSVFDAGVYVPDANAAQVARLYYGLLDRAPDAGGLQSLTASVAQGASLHVVAQTFLASGEYEFKTTGLTDAQFVDTMYGQILGRAGDGAGEQAWSGYLAQGGSRSGMINGFTDSLEFQSKYTSQSNGTYVEALYEHVLGRHGDANGLQIWTSNLDAHTMTRTDVAHVFSASAEFQTKYVAPSDERFVDSLYEGALGRPADAAGLQAWTNALVHSASRADVAVGIAESPEAQQHLVGQIEAGWHLA